MRLAIFNDYRLGIMSSNGTEIMDASGALPWPHDPDPVGAGWWVRLCRDLPALRPALEQQVQVGEWWPLETVTLRPPALNPSKVIACAINYAAHGAEMPALAQRIGAKLDAWLLEFDIFLKAPSSIVGPSDAIVLPKAPFEQGKEIHHESELVLVVGQGGFNIPEAEAFSHIAGYTIGLDMTVRGDGDRSRRKSYETFSPLGPWMTTTDEIRDPHALEIRLSVDGTMRQDVNTGDMTVKIPGIIAYASSIMRLTPGDVIFTGAPPGVGPVHPGETVEASISGIGSMRLPVRGPAH